MQVSYISVTRWYKNTALPEVDPTRNFCPSLKFSHFFLTTKLLNLPSFSPSTVVPLNDQTFLLNSFYLHDFVSSGWWSIYRDESSGYFPPQFGHVFAFCSGPGFTRVWCFGKGRVRLSTVSCPKVCSGNGGDFSARAVGNLF